MSPASRLSDNEGVFSGWRLDACLLALFAFVFCVQYYHANFIFHGDVFLNLYIHGNPRLFELGWDPYIWGYLGWYPVYGSVFPLNIPMHLIQSVLDTPYSALKLIQLNAGISLFLLSFTTYLFFRFLGRSRAASLAGSVVASFTGFHAHTSIRELDLFYLHSFMFVPLALMFLVKAGRQAAPANTLLAGLMIGLSLLGGTNVPMFLIVPFFPLAFLIDRPLRTVKVKDFLKGTLTAAAAGIIGMIVGAAMVIPSMKFMDLTDRQAHINRDVLMIKDTLYTIKAALYRDIFTGQMFDHEFDAYLGLIVLAMAAFGVFACLKKSKTAEEGGAFIKGGLFMGALLAYSVLMMQLAYLPEALQGVITRWFSLLSVRFPYRHMMLVLLAAGFFAAVGLDSFKTASSRRKGIFTVIVSLSAIAYFAYGMPSIRTITAHYAIISAPLAFAVWLISFYYVLKKRPGLAGPWGLGLPMILFALFSLSRPDTPARPYKGESMMLYPNTVKKSIDNLYNKPEGEWGPVLKNSRPFRIFNKGPILRMNIWAPRAGADIAFEPLADPATPLYIRKYSEQINSLYSPLWDLYNVAYMAETKSLYALDGKDLVTDIMYENPDAFDRFFITHGVKGFATENELFKALAGASRDELRDYVFLTGVPSNSYTPFPEGNEGIKIIERTPGRIVIEAVLSAPGHLCASELWFPAWEVMVDGKKAGLLRAYGTFWAVGLDAGRHTVEFTFYDRYAFWGKAVSAGTIMLILAGVVFIRRKPKGS